MDWKRNKQKKLAGNKYTGFSIETDLIMQSKSFMCHECVN